MKNSGLEVDQRGPVTTGDLRSQQVNSREFSRDGIASQVRHRTPSATGCGSTGYGGANNMNLWKEQVSTGLS